MTKNTCYFRLDRVWNIHVETTENIREISDSNLETSRDGLKSGVSRVIWESWQPGLGDEEQENQERI